MAPPDMDGHGNLPPGRAVAEMWTQRFGTDRDGNERGFVVVPA